jgi:hypothetical protein
MAHLVFHSQHPAPGYLRPPGQNEAMKPMNPMIKISRAKKSFFSCAQKNTSIPNVVYIYNKWYLLVLSHDTISSPCPVKKGLYILISPWFLSAPPCTGHGPWALGPKTGRVVVHGQEVLQLGFSNSEGTYRTSLTSYRNLCSISTYGTSWDIITMLHVLSSSQVGWCSKYWVSHLNSY